MRHRLRVAGATREVFAGGALREISRLSGGVPRLINIICDRALLGAFTEDRHLVTASVVRRAAGEVFGKTIQPRWLPWATGTAVTALAIASLGLVVPRFLAPAPAPATVAEVPPPPPPPAPPPPPNLDHLLAQYDSETDPDNAFHKLFKLWGMRYVAGSTDPCMQALQSGLECLTQRGSLAQLRLFNRPAVLNVVDSDGHAHQLVLAGLDDEHAQIDLGAAQLMGSDQNDERYARPQGLMVSLTVETPAEVERIFNELSAGGQITMPMAETFWAQRFGMLVDRFGIPFMIGCNKAR